MTMTLDEAIRLLETCERCCERSLVGNFCPGCADYVPSLLRRVGWAAGGTGPALTDKQATVAATS